MCEGKRAEGMTVGRRERNICDGKYVQENTVNHITVCDSAGKNLIAAFPRDLLLPFLHGVQQDRN